MDLEEMKRINQSSIEAIQMKNKEQEIKQVIELKTELTTLPMEVMDKIYGWITEMKDMYKKMDSRIRDQLTPEQIEMSLTNTLEKTLSDKVMDELRYQMQEYKAQLEDISKNKRKYVIQGILIGIAIGIGATILWKH